MSLTPASTPVPHPGARPGDLTLPIAEAQAALAAIEDELADLSLCSQVHDDAAAGAVAGFEGRSRTAFDQGLGACLNDLATLRQQLTSDAEELRRWLAQARRALDQRRSAQRSWDQQWRAYEADRRARRLAQPS